MPKAWFLVFRVLFDAENGSIVGVNDHIVDLSILHDLNLVLAFLVLVCRFGRGAAHFLFCGAYGLGKRGVAGSSVIPPPVRRGAESPLCRLLAARILARSSPKEKGFRI